MPIIFSGQEDRYYNPPKFGYGFGHGFTKKKASYNSFYNGGAWRDFGNNVVLGNKLKPEFIAEKKIKEALQQQAMDTIIKKTARTKEDVIGNGFKFC